MSDVWQGPGWWLAPDGKWYPAEGGPTEGARAESEGRSDDEAPPPPAEPIGDAEPAEPRGGWTAVEPEAGVDDEPSLSDDAQWADDAEAADEDAAGGATAAEPVVADAAVPERRPTGTTEEPIERDDAWRKPGEGGDPLDVAERSGAPAVVDVTEATDAFLGEPTEVPAPSPWRGVLLALGFLAAIIGFSILVGLFFTNVVFDDDGTSTEATTTTDQSAPTTDAPATTESSTDSSAASTTEDPALGTEVSVFELETGDCIEGDIGSGPLERLIRVDCSVPHQFEVYTEDVLDPSITEFDEEAINAAAETICRDALDAYIPADDERNIQFKWFQPTAESWAQEDDPDRAITCLLFDADGPMTGRAA